MWARGSVVTAARLPGFCSWRWFWGFEGAKRVFGLWVLSAGCPGVGKDMWGLSPAWGWEWGAGVSQWGVRKGEELQERPVQMEVRGETEAWSNWASQHQQHPSTRTSEHQQHPSTRASEHQSIPEPASSHHQHHPSTSIIPVPASFQHQHHPSTRASEHQNIPASEHPSTSSI